MEKNKKAPKEERKGCIKEIDIEDAKLVTGGSIDDVVFTPTEDISPDTQSKA